MKAKSIYTKKLGQSVAAQAQPVTAGKYHVISVDTKWSVVSEGSVKALKAFNSVEQAVNFAKDIAEKKTGEVIIHEKTGQISARISYRRVQ